MKICPRCDRTTLDDDDALNAISHIDNKTLICSACGSASGMIAQDALIDDVELAMDARFRERLEAKK